MEIRPCNGTMMSHLWAVQEFQTPAMGTWIRLDIGLQQVYRWCGPLHVTTKVWYKSYLRIDWTKILSNLDIITSTSGGVECTSHGCHHSAAGACWIQGAGQACECFRQHEDPSSKTQARRPKFDISLIRVSQLWPNLSHRRSCSYNWGFSNLDEAYLHFPMHEPMPRTVMSDHETLHLGSLQKVWPEFKVFFF